MVLKDGACISRKSIINIIMKFALLRYQHGIPRAISIKERKHQQCNSLGIFDLTRSLDSSGGGYLVRKGICG